MTAAIIVISIFVLLTLIKLITTQFFEKRWLTYQIEKGEHFSDIKGWPLWQKLKVNLEEDDSLTFLVVFKKSCLYDKDKVGDQINKLYGMSCGNHLQFSIRIGWRCENHVRGKISLFAYWYDCGKLNYELLGHTYPGDCEKMKLEMGDKEFTASLLDPNNDEIISQHTVYLDKECHKIRYKLYPYFGGTVPAPHDMEIDIYEIE